MPTALAEDCVSLPASLAHMRRFALDGALLLFDRTTGLTVHCEGDETKGLVQRGPRVVQFGITNRCNLACTFCSRDVEARSEWTPESAFAILADLAKTGVLEVAFGGGEPFAFKGFEALVRRLWLETPLAVSMTTNGTLLTEARIDAIAGHYGQLRISLYDDVDWRAPLAILVQRAVTFGVNWLVTPERLPTLEAIVLELVSRGCRDILLLSYNGSDRALHLDAASSADLARRVALLARALGNRTQLKLDVCWGERMDPVPQLAHDRDCPAGRDFVVLTSERTIAPCSFHHRAWPVETAADVLRIWNDERASLALPARDPGCARAPGFGLVSHPASPSAARHLAIVGVDR